MHTILILCINLKDIVSQNTNDNASIIINNGGGEQRRGGIRKLDLVMTYWMMIMLTMTKTMRMMKVINFTFTITSHNTWKHLLGRPNALAKILFKI